MSSNPYLAERLRLTRDVLTMGPNAFERDMGLDFRPFDANTCLAAWHQLADHAKSGRLCNEIALYVHLPFCGKVCSYCLLSTARTPGGRFIDRYIDALKAELAHYAPILAAFQITSVHIGGGTPTLLSEAQLTRVFDVLSSVVDLSRCPVGIEASPGTFTEVKGRLFVSYDVDRVSFGVETLTPEVLRAVRRTGQTTSMVSAAVDAARRAGIREVNVDLLAGLPQETVESFADSVKATLALDIDSMSVNRYIAENAPLSAAGHVPDPDERAVCDAMLMKADEIIRATKPATRPEEPLRKAGYGTQYVWDTREGARSYFQQDMIGPGSTLTLGHGAMGHLHGGGFYTTACSLNEYVESLEEGGLPEILLSPVSMRFEMAHYFADRACRGTFSEAAFSAMFSVSLLDAFGPELAFLLKAGLLTRHGDQWRKPENLDFQIHHLVCFLRRTNDELRRLHALSGDAHPLHRTRDGLLFIGNEPPGDAFSSRDGQEGKSVFAHELGAKEVERLAQISLHELIRPVESVRNQSGWTGVQAHTIRSVYAQATSDEELQDILEVARASQAQRVLLNTGSHCSSSEARSILERANRSRLSVELIPMSAPSDVYSVLEVDLAASVFWCRIAMEACRAGRRASRAELRI